MEKLFVNIYTYFSNHKKVYWIILGLFIAVCGLLASRISFEEDISRLLNFDKNAEKLNTLLQHSKSTDKLVMRIYGNENSERDSLMLLADIFKQKLDSACKDYLKEVRGKIETDEFLEVYGLITQNVPDFIEENHWNQTINRALNPAKLDSTIGTYVRMMGTPGSMMIRQGFQNDPVALSLPHLEKLRELQASAQFEVIDNYLFSKDGKNIILLLYPQYGANETAHNRKLVKEINKIIDEFKITPAAQNYHVQYFGSIAVSVGNAEQIQKDTYITLFVASIMLLLLLLSVFRKKRLPLLILVTVGFGLLFSLAMISLFKNSISLIAIGTGAVILGVAVNYPIHFFTHYIHNKDIPGTIKSMVFPMTIGSLTTIGGFFCLTFTDSDLLKDFGLFAAFCLIGAVVFSLIFLPHLAGKVKESSKSNWIKKGLENLSRYPFDKKPVFLIIILVLTPILFYFSFQVQYEDNLDKINFMTPEMKQVESDFFKLSQSDRNIFMITQGHTAEEALYNSYKMMLLTDSLSKKGFDCRFSGVVKAIPPKSIQQKRISMWNAYWTNPSQEKLKGNITQTFIKHDLDPQAFNRFFESLNGAQTILSDADYNFLLKTFAKDFLYESDTLSTVVSQVMVSPDHRSSLIEIINKDPNTVVIDKRFLSQSLINTVSNDFNKIAFLTSVLVFLALLLSYGRIELTLIAFIPMVISWIWVLGFMALFDIKFNIVNIILSTFIFGLGDDFCIFTMDGKLKEYTRNEGHSSTIRLSILISGLTGLIGLGVLIFAKHPAIYSLATISVLGIFSVLFISQTLQPYLFDLCIKKPVAKKHAPITLLTFINAILTFVYFFLGCIIINVMLPFLFLFPKKKRKLLLHYLICYFVRSLVYGCFVIKKIKTNLQNEDFSKPAIIVANHQSMLDILHILSLHPKIVIMVKRWVWNSPIMGPFVRAAGFFTIDEGVESHLGDYQKTIEEGYSIVVFPEGSRSDGRKINRFHKGAFFLTEQLGIDVLPIMIQNNYESLPKDIIAVYPCQMTLKIYPRIKPDDEIFGSTYQERAKSISQWYKKEYTVLGEQNANARYCMRKLRDGYMFYSPMLEWYLRIKVKMEKTYEAFENIVPKSGTIVDAGCGYGFLVHTLAMRSHQRILLGIDYDEEKINAAQNPYLQNERISFITADIMQYEFPQADCFILSDVLHYLSFEKTREILYKLNEKISERGVIIIRDADKDNNKEHRFNRISEFLSTKIFKFNKTANKLNFFSSGLLMEEAVHLGFAVEEIDNKHAAINKMIVLRKRGSLTMSYE